LRIFRERK